MPHGGSRTGIGTELLSCNNTWVAYALNGCLHVLDQSFSHRGFARDPEPPSTRVSIFVFGLARASVNILFRREDCSRRSPRPRCCWIVVLKRSRHTSLCVSLQQQDIRLSCTTPITLIDSADLPARCRLPCLRRTAKHSLQGRTRSLAHLTQSTTIFSTSRRFGARSKNSSLLLVVMVSSAVIPLSSF